MFKRNKPFENEMWSAHRLLMKAVAAHWTGAVHYLCLLIIMHIGLSVGSRCPMTFKIIIVS